MNVKHISQPWFDAILNGTKKYEGRMFTGFWRTLQIGSRFKITDGKKTQEVQVEELIYFDNFGDAWFDLRDDLIPSTLVDIVIKEHAIKLYSKYYTQEDVKKYGVVAIKLKVVDDYVTQEKYGFYSI
jgi:ASC-1-like (ASCH) protein